MLRLSCSIGTFHLALELVFGQIAAKLEEETGKRRHVW
jgi:hypothetical protein